MMSSYSIDYFSKPRTDPADSSWVDALVSRNSSVEEPKNDHLARRISDPRNPSSRWPDGLLAACPADLSPFPPRLPLELWMMINELLVPMHTPMRVANWNADHSAASLVIDDPVYNTIEGYSQTNFLWLNGQSEFRKVVMPRGNWHFTIGNGGSIGTSLDAAQDIRDLQNMWGGRVRHVTLVIESVQQGDNEVNQIFDSLEAAFDQVLPVIECLHETQQKCSRKSTTLRIQLVTYQTAVRTSMRVANQYLYDYTDAYYETSNLLCAGGPEHNLMRQWKDLCAEMDIELTMDLLDQRRVVNPTARTPSGELWQCTRVRKSDMTQFCDDLDTLPDELVEGNIFTDDEEDEKLAAKAVARHQIWDELAGAAKEGPDEVRSWLEIFHHDFPDFFHSTIRHKYASYLDH